MTVTKMQLIKNLQVGMIVEWSKTENKKIIPINIFLDIRK